MSSHTTYYVNYLSFINANSVNPNEFHLLQASHPDMHPQSTTVKISLFTPESSVKELISAMVGLQCARWGMIGNVTHLPVSLLEIKRETVDINNLKTHIIKLFLLCISLVPRHLPCRKAWV